MLELVELFRKMEVQLIRPPLDDWYQIGQFQELISVPTGLCMLASKLRNVVDVEVRDGMYKPKEYCSSFTDDVADIVGVSTLYSNVMNTIATIKAAKKNDSITVLGGYNIDYLAERFLEQVPELDYIIVGQGEDSLPLLVQGENPETIPGLVYRKDGKAVRNPQQPTPPKTLFDLDNLVDLHNLDKDNYFPLVAVRGCIKREESGPCSFCSITDKLKVADPKLFWEQVSLVAEKYGASRFWETGDDFIVGDYPQRILAARPNHLSDVKLRMYTSPDRINREVLRTLKELNTEELFLGVESFNDNLLRTAGKSYSTKDITHALSLIAEADLFPEEGAGLHIPFLFGLPGETPKTVNNTYEFAKSLLGTFPTARTVVSMPLPLAGTKLFEELKNNQRVRARYSGNLDKDILFDYRELVQLQCEEYNSVTLEQMEEMIDKIKKLMPGEGKTTSFTVNKEKLIDS
jgi:radical SAM superfamily enzyme YgiQ (UPF0313 family)